MGECAAPSARPYVPTCQGTASRLWRRWCVRTRAVSHACWRIPTRPSVRGSSQEVQPLASQTRPTLPGSISAAGEGRHARGFLNERGFPVEFKAVRFGDTRNERPTYEWAFLFVGSLILYPSSQKEDRMEERA